MTHIIPKIIHYTWFSGEPFPESIKNCIESWHHHMPNYEFRLWDMDAIKDIDSVFLKEALSCRKWAYAADFIRLYAVYHEGGIYLDTDVMVYKSLDSYLKDRAFIGKETSIHFTGRMSSQYLSSHCFGAEAHHPYIKQCLDYYSNRHFITSNIESLPNPLRLNIVILPYIQAEIARLIGYDWKPLHQDVQHLKDGLVIYPSHIFDPIEQNVQSVCRHLALGSWRDEKSSNQTCSIWYKFEWRIIKLLQKILDKFNYKIVKIQ